MDNTGVNNSGANHDRNSIFLGRLCGLVEMAIELDAISNENFIKKYKEFVHLYMTGNFQEGIGPSLPGPNFTKPTITDTTPVTMDDVVDTTPDTSFSDDDITF